MDANNRKPNDLLRRERKLRCWTLEQVANALDELCQEEPRTRKRDGIINESMISRWERGIHPPSPFYQRMLCQLFDKPAEALGFVDPLPGKMTESSSPLQHVTGVLSNVPQDLSTAHSSTQAIDVLCAYADDATPGQQLGVWLALSVQNLMPLFDAQWTPHMVLEALHTLLPGVHAMSQISRRAFGQHLLRLGVAGILSGIPIPAGKHVSAEERMELHRTLSESIAVGWKLFHSAGNAQVLAVGQAQLFLLQQVGPLLSAREQALFYSPVYRLIGGTLHLQGRYYEALNAHHKAYLTALEGGDVWNMAQSRMWQASGLKEQGQYAEALQTIEAAVSLSSMQNDLESVRTTAHLLASGAEIAAIMGDDVEVQSKLSSSEQWLEHLPSQHEEFDRAGWCEIAGVCALHLKQHDLAVKRLTQAIETLPPQSVLRHVTAYMPLVMAYANIGERNLSFSTAEQALPHLQALGAPDMNRQFVQYTTHALSSAFPHDTRIQTFLVDMQQQLLPQHTSAIKE
jgi:tetratricopeptide (TPR) repeat protein/transcriptional regulator with XRE-family HTH domain